MKTTSLHLPIATERMTLRWYREDDLEAFMDLERREDETAQIPRKRRTRQETVEGLRSKIAATTLESDGDVLTLVVERSADGVYLGEVVLFLVSRQHRQGEVGCVFHPDHHGKGYATEATVALIDAGFNTFGFHRIRARLDAKNAPSERLVERLGMRHEAHLIENELYNGVWEDELVYAILDREWRSRL